MVPGIRLVFALALAGQVFCGRCPENAAYSMAESAIRSLDTLDLTFLNPSVGWWLAMRRGQNQGLQPIVFVSQTTDGGRTWHSIGTIPGAVVRQAGEEVSRVSTIRFVTLRDGWAYGPALSATHDGGRTWKRLAIQGTETAVSIAGRSIWRLDTQCSDATCRATLLTSIAGTDGWQRSGWQPPPSWTTGGIITRADARDAWLLSGEITTPSNRITRRLLGTTDSGKSWHELPVPCATQGSVEDTLAALDSRHVWAFCGSEPGAGEQLKAVSRSDDGGKHWRLVSASGEFGLRNLPSSGYLNGAVLTSPSNGWLALDRGTLLHTANGGRTWRAAIPHAQANLGDGGVGPVMFVDSRHGWLFSFPDLLFRTVDGGHHWEDIRLISTSTRSDEM